MFRQPHRVAYVPLARVTAMRLAPLLVLALLAAGCAQNSPPYASPSGTEGAQPGGVDSDGGVGGLDGESGAVAPHQVTIDETLTYKAAARGCPTPSIMVEGTYARLDLSDAIGLNLTLEWTAGGTLDATMGFSFASGTGPSSAGPTDTEYASTSGTSPLQWRMDERQAADVQESDRLRTTGPVCTAGAPPDAQTLIDVSIHVTGTKTVA